MKWNINLFNHRSGVKLSPFKAWLAYFVDFTIPMFFTRLFMFIVVVGYYAYVVGIIIFIFWFLYHLLK